MPTGPIFDASTLDGSDGFEIPGLPVNDSFGSAVATGDVNGDGFDDILVGAYYSGGEQAYLIFGTGAAVTTPISIADLDGTDGYRFTGEFNNDFAGSTVDLGDINGDGLADIIISSPRANITTPSTLNAAGAISVIFGGTAALAALDAANGATDGAIILTNLDGVDGFRLEGGQANGELGRGPGDKLDVGDFNGDGFGDIIVGAGLYDAQAGEAIILFGKNTGFDAVVKAADLDGADGFRLQGVTPGEIAGYGIAFGDLNGDGLDDAIIGASRSADVASDAGKAYVFYGRPGGVSADTSLAIATGFNGFQIDGTAAFDNAGDAFAVGDFNGDGQNDLAMSFNGFDFGGDGAGAVGIFFGPFGSNTNVGLADLNGSNGFRIDGAGSNGRLGQGLAAGDFNGDGVDDLAIGQGFSGDDAYIIYGKTTEFSSVLSVATLDGQDGLTLTGLNSSSAVQESIAFGDTNGDGFDDLMIGSAAISGGGNVKVILGEATGPITRSGAGGVDRLVGGAFADVLSGGEGDDTITGAGGSDALTGGGGDDVITAADGDDDVSGNDGDDNLDGGDGDDFIRGGAGVDTLTGGNGNDLVFGGSGNDIFVGVAGDGAARDRDIFDGGSGVDRLTFVTSAVGVEVKLQNGTALTTDGDLIRLTEIENVFGSFFAENFIVGDDEDNILIGGGSNDVIFGELGDDSIFGIGGENVLQGGIGDDLLAATNVFGNGGADTFLRGGSGNDVVHGAAGNDSGQGDSGTDTFNGNGGNDLFFGGTGDDVLNGGDGNDALRGDTQNDTLNGDDGDDGLKGGSGNDILVGGDGTDTLLGENGDDTLTGGAGVDRITGGAGTDTFKLVDNFGFDKIFDFEDGSETLDFTGNATINSIGDLIITAFNLGADTKITDAGNAANFIILVGVTSGNVDAGDMTF